MKQLSMTKSKLHEYIKSMPRTKTYVQKVIDHFNEDEYLLFTFKPNYYGFVFHCCDGFLLERVFNKMIDPSTTNYNGIDFEQYTFIKKWYEEDTYGFIKEKDKVKKKIDYIYKVNQLKYLLERK